MHTNKRSPLPAWQVLNQTSRMEIQLLETSLSTNKLEKQLLLQGHELNRLQGRNRWALGAGYGLGARFRLDLGLRGRDQGQSEGSTLGLE